jgi:transcriptional regulator with XRE-family HTH domain
LKRLKFLPQQRSLSQAALARRARLNQTTISLLEPGKFAGDAVQLARPAQVQETPAERLLDDVDIALVEKTPATPAPVRRGNRMNSSGGDKTTA